MIKAFEKITAENTIGLAESNQVILMNIFFKKKQSRTLEPHMLILTQKYILYYHNHTKTKIKRILKIDFNTKFEILKTQDLNYTGIRFQRDGCKSYQLFTHENHVIKLWEKQLQKRINKRGFHQQYRAIKKIGKGNFAAVYLAIKIQQNKQFAIKAFSKQQLYSNQKGKQSIINEIKLLRQLNHNNILKLYTVYQSSNSIYLVLQYYQGYSLNSAIRNQRFSLTKIREIMIGILSALTQLANKNIIHRDVKPENIMFRTRQINSDIVLLDFGLSTFADQKEYIYTRCGTPGFVAPQIVNIKNLNAKSKPISDIFSLGIIFHILLIGRSPFTGKTFSQILAQNRECSFILQGNQYEWLPNNAYDLLKKMLCKNPNLRITADQCLKHKFFRQYDVQLEQSFESIIKNPEQPRNYESKLQDSLGKFQMKRNIKKIKQQNSLQFKIKQQIQKFKDVKNTNKSKFKNFRKNSQQYCVS